MTESAPRYIFSGHAIGAGAHFHRLDDTQNLNHVVPTQGATVLPPTGGESKAHVSNFSFDVDHPRPRTLLTVRQIDSTASGRSIGAKFETEVQTDIQAIKVLDKLRIERVRVHMLSTFDSSVDGSDPVVTTKGNLIEGMWLGKVEARVLLDDEPLCACGTQDQLAKFYQDKGEDYRQQNASRFAIGAGNPAGGPYRLKAHKCSLVRKIELRGSEIDLQNIELQPDGFTIYWKGFGRIILGEVYVKGNDRQLTLVRLAMGSDAAGTGTAGDGKTNGTIGG